MKKSLQLLLLSLIALTASAQFPVSTGKDMEMELYHFYKYGAPLELPGSLGEYNNTLARTTIATKNTLITTITQSVGAGRMWLMSSFKVTADRPVRLVISIKQDGGFGQFFSQNGATNIGTNAYGQATPDAPYTYDFGVVPLKFFEGGSIEIKAYSLADGQETPYMTYTPQGVQKGFDEFYNAKKTIMLLGVSIDWSTLGNNAAGNGQNAGNTLWGYRVRDYLRSNSCDVQLINKAFGQSRIGDAAKQIISGKYQGQKIDALFLHFGENNYFDGASTSQINQFKADYRTVINFIKLSPVNKNSPVFCIVPGPTDVPGAVSYAEAYRQAVIDVVSEYSGQGVYSYNPNAPVNSVYTIQLATSNNVQGSDFTEKTLLTQLHWQGDTGHLKMANGFISENGTLLINLLRTN